MHKTLLIVALAPLTLAAACGGHHRGEVDPARVNRQVTAHLDDVLDDIDATDAQRTRIFGVKDRLLPEATSFATASRNVRKEVVGQLAADRPDAARLHRLVDERVEAFRLLAHKSVDGVMEAHATLSPDQRAELTKKMRRFADH